MYFDAVKRESEKRKNQLIDCCFIAWQMGAGKKGSTFNDYLKTMNLSEKEKPLTKAQKKKVVSRALYVAERALKHDKLRKK